MTASTLLQGAVATLKERAFQHAAAPLFEGRRHLLEHAAPRFAFDEETLHLVLHYTPAVQGVLDYYEAEIERVRQRYYGKSFDWTFAQPAARPHPQL